MVAVTCTEFCTPVTWPATLPQDRRAFPLLLADGESEPVEGEKSALGPGAAGWIRAGVSGIRTPDKLAPDSGNGEAAWGGGVSCLVGLCIGSLRAHLEDCWRCKNWEAMASPACRTRHDPGMPPPPWGWGGHREWGCAYGCFPAKGRGEEEREGEGPTAGHCCS